MRLRNFIVAAFVLALAVPGLAAAEKPEDAGRYSDFKVTGGGQILSEDHAGGAGDTVGFNAQEIEGDDGASDAPNDAARGQFQYVPRGENDSQQAPAEKFHGVVTCLISGDEAVANEAAEGDGNVEEALAAGMARFGGYVRYQDDTVQYFTVDVNDKGQGGDTEDEILVRFTSEPCGDNPEDEDGSADELARLARGNVKIHNYRAAEPAAAVAAATAIALQ